MRDYLRYHRSHEHLHSAFGNDLYGRSAEKVARSMGTPQFLITQSLVLVAWIIVNGILVAIGLGIAPWDPYPFILLNLMLSFQAAYSAPFILVAANRQAERDKAREVADAVHREELAKEQLVLLQQHTEMLKAHTEQLALQQEQVRLLHYIAKQLPKVKVKPNAHR